MEAHAFSTCVESLDSTPEARFLLACSSAMGPAAQLEYLYQTENGKTIAPVEHRAGWDATFSAPKSVSLTALVGGDDRVREAHRAAVNVALNELERYTQARIGGNHTAEMTGRFVAAKFEHDKATYPEVRAVFESRLAAGEFRPIASEKHATGRQFTTAFTIRAEREVLRRVREDRGQSPPIMPIEKAVHFTDAHPHLNPGQPLVLTYRASVRQAARTVTKPFISKHTERLLYWEHEAVSYGFERVGTD